MATPCSASRSSHARSSGEAFIALGNTRPEDPTNVSLPSPAAHSRTAALSNAARIGSKNARAAPNREKKSPIASAWVRFNPDLPAINSLRPTVGIPS